MRYETNRIIVHCADIALKGKNRPQFEALLARQIRTRLRRVHLDWPVRRASGRLMITLGADDGRVEDALAILAEIPGIATYFPAQWFAPASAGRDRRSLLEGPLLPALLDLACARHAPGARFALRVERHDDALAISTREFERLWGAQILAHTPWQGVDLSAPDRTFHVGLYPDGALLYAERRSGLGGMPAGSGGRVLALLSGGIDSPVAAFLMARRGCAVDCLHFAANYIERDGAERSPVGRLAARLSRYTQTLTLHVAPYVAFDLALAGARSGYELVLFRRFMLRCAERLAQRTGAAALVTGDSLSQVASQTLSNLVALDAAVAVPVFRPLIGYNKQEIIARARAIGTYRTSIEPYKDCCALIARGAKTRVGPERIAALERRRLPEYDRLVDSVLAETATLRFAAGERVAEPGA